MGKDGYRWWKERLRSMGQFFDAYRIDHVLGFFRIWEIPSCQVQGLMGHFRPALPLSEKEIHGWGFHADIERYCRPFVTKAERERLKEQFPHADLDHFLIQAADDSFELREHVDTQRKIAGLDCDEKLKKALMEIAAEVLFIKDPDGGGYHPRIMGHETRAFQTLDNYCRQAFNSLYEDFSTGATTNFGRKRRSRKWRKSWCRAATKSWIPCCHARKTSEWCLAL